MASIRKSYFTLDELVGGWGLPKPTCATSPRTACCMLSVRVIGLLMEFGTYEERRRGPISVPCEHRYHDGLLDLYRRDVFALFRDGVVEPRYFEQPEATPARRDDDTLAVWLRDLLVRADERPRFEAEVLPTPADGGDRISATSPTSGTTAGVPLHADPGEGLRSCTRWPSAGAPGSRARRRWPRAARSSLKLGDLFKRRPAWRELIEADGRGSIA